MIFITEENPDWFIINDSKGKKKRLLKIARNGGKRPNRERGNKEERILGRALGLYVSKNGNAYDPYFEKEIKRISNWFVKPAKTPHSIIKQGLLELAISGEKRPQHSKNIEEEKIRNMLFQYVCINGSYYDPVFDKKIRGLRPDWFISTADVNKKKLLEIAKNGEKRPSKNKLNQCLCHYISSDGACYDPLFDKKIRGLRPDWFINTADIKKQELLQMAKSGKKRPVQRSKIKNECMLGNAVSAYTRKKSLSYDADFDKKLRITRPDWFRKNK